MRYEDAARAAGIDDSTFYRWKARGEEAKGGKFRAFREALKKAEAEGERENLETIKRASARNWQAAAWLLERRYPEKWGRRDSVDVTSGGEKVKVVLSFGGDGD